VLWVGPSRECEEQDNAEARRGAHGEYSEPAGDSASESEGMTEGSRCETFFPSTSRP
jgi:hypothetical protein